MAITGISEFTFGFAFLFEQTQRNWEGLKAAPILPSLRQEQDDAWDARLPLIGIDYYYQFKLSDYLHAPNAKYIRNGTYDAPYYRIALHRQSRNRQHTRLRQLSQNNPHTYYVSPEFYQMEDFNNSFLARQITESTRLIPISRCQDFEDSEQHYITFQLGSSQWREWSKPRLHRQSGLGKNIEQIYRNSAGEWRAINENFAEDLFAKTEARIRVEVEQEKGLTRSIALVENIDRPIEFMLNLPPPPPTMTGHLTRAAELISTYYGATMVLVGVPQE